METLGQLLTKQSRAYGEKTFCYFENEKLTYESFEATTNALAQGLLAAGCKPGSRIAFLLPNIPEWLITFFGTVKAGCVALPINSLLKKEEIRFILQNSEATCLITIPSFIEMINEIKPELADLKNVYILDEQAARGMKLFDELLSEDDQPPEGKIDPKSTACVIYTSGMTGRPKGAMLSHTNYLTNAQQIVESLGINETDRVLNILPMNHVNAQLSTFLAPLSAGASMVLMRGFSARQFLPALERYQITAFAGVPTVYAILNELADADDYDLSRLRFCICGSAPMPVNVFEMFEQKYKTKIIEGYGLTEATCAVTINPIRGKRKIGSIGKPLPGVDIKILDDQDREVPCDQEGEVVVRGDIVMLGYLKDPEATAETLREGWLHTGDIGFVDQDGYYYIRGRKKEMIIRGGENIYPREIEEILIHHPQVKEVAVIGHPHPIWGEEVTAYVIPEGAERPSSTNIMEYCRRRLADYKCPTRVVFVEEMPKTALMKVRRWALREE